MSNIGKLWKEWVLVKSKEANIDVTGERVIVGKNGQWKLEKANMFIPDHWADEFKAEKEAKEKGLPSPKAVSGNKSELSDMFHQLNHAVIKYQDTKPHIEKIRDHIMNAPKGSIDIGHLGNLVEQQPRAPGKALNHRELEEIIRPHIEDVKDLKEIHDKHGGDDALRTIMRIHGTGGENVHGYTKGARMFANPKVLGDLVDAVRPGKGKWLADLNFNQIEHKSEHLDTDWDEGLHKKVKDTWDKMYKDNWSTESMKDHEDAVIERGLEHLKRHYNLK